jgi:uracil-DNA glycosylase
MPIQVLPDGPADAKIMLVGEAPGADEEREGRPFVGASGQELNRMLHEAGISRSECFCTNVSRERPLNNDISNFIAKTKKERTSEHTLFNGKYVRRPIVEGVSLLEKEIQMVSPHVIIALGNVPLWGLTGLWGITKWRGSMLHKSGTNTKIVPTYHPAAILRQWDWRATAVNDLRRAARFRDGQDYPVPGWKFLVRPSFSQVQETLQLLTSMADKNFLELSFDLETRAGHITCAGLAWTLTDALCIPFTSKDNLYGYWSEEEETLIVYALYRLLTYPRVRVIGQNLLYDSQYTYRHWHFIPRVSHDTMISWHVAFPGLPKRLDYQASLLCDQYKQWKPDKSVWKAGG